MKRLLIFLLSILLVLSIFIPVSANHPPITLKYDGKVVKCDVPPVIREDRTLIPARALFEELGADITWNSSKKTVTVEYNDDVILLTIGSKNATLNKLKVAMDVPAMIVEDRTMIPVRFVAENLGFDVEWDAKKYIVNVKPKIEHDYKLSKVYVQSYEEETVIRLNDIGSAKLSKLTLTDPKRLIFDFDSTVLATETNKIICDDEFLTSVRLGQFSDTTTRVVLDIKDNVNYKITEKVDKDDYLIYLRSHTFKPIDDEKVVFIDAGHGGSEVGAIGTLYDKSSFDSDGKLLDLLEKPKVKKEVYEKDINLSIALKTDKLLKKAGVKTCMLRTTDKYINIYDRPIIANDKNAFMYLSIHNNASTSESVNGVQVYYSDECPSYPDMTNKELATIFYNSIAKSTGLRKAGVVDNPRYIVINQTKMPALILEIAFVTNQEDLEKLLDDKFLDKVAQGICNGTVEALEKIEI